MIVRQVAAFRGTAQCRREDGAVQWSISGVDRDGGEPLEVLLSGAGGLKLPPQLTDPELFVRDELADASWELRGNGTVYPLTVRAAQVHRGAAAAFAASLPEVSLSWGTRARWWLLLAALRLPGMTHVLRLLRTGRGE
jgi:hypothetical protein